METLVYILARLSRDRRKLYECPIQPTEYYQTETLALSPKVAEQIPNSYFTSQEYIFGRVRSRVSITNDRIHLGYPRNCSEFDILDSGHCHGT